MSAGLDDLAAFCSHIEEPAEPDEAPRIAVGNWYCLMCQRDLYHACPLHGPNETISRRKPGPSCNHCGNELFAPQTFGVATAIGADRFNIAGEAGGQHE